MGIRAYYNEHDRSAAEWLRELIREGVITDGTVDERSIEDVVPAELAEFDRCHFFAGIGVWDYALTRAGWPDDRRVWTGSCPCQPFSAAGKGDGFADERHLWPAWFHLIEQCRPRVIFGEQVSSKDTLPWIDLVHADLEGALYTVGAADLCSPSVGAPHIRQRLYFAAESERQRELRGSGNGNGSKTADERSGSRIGIDEIGNGSSTHDLAKPVSVGRRGRSERPDEREIRDGGCSEIQIEGSGDISESGNRPTAGSGGSGDVVDSISVRGTRRTAGIGSMVNAERERRRNEPGQSSGSIEVRSTPGPTNGFWRDAEWIYCRDGKWRPVGTVESGAFEMADELAADLGCVRHQSSGRYTISPLIEKGKGRVARLRGYGNAITAEVAIAFISSYLEVSND